VQESEDRVFQEQQNINYAAREEARKITKSLKVNKILVCKSVHPVKNYNQYDSLSRGV
jgi:hypothetical protein